MATELVVLSVLCGIAFSFVGAGLFLMFPPKTEPVPIKSEDEDPTWTE